MQKKSRRRKSEQETSSSFDNSIAPLVISQRNSFCVVCGEVQIKKTQLLL
jgi:hypothetical protein